MAEAWWQKQGAPVRDIFTMLSEQENGFTRFIPCYFLQSVHSVHVHFSLTALCTLSESFYLMMAVVLVSDVFF